MRENFLFIGGAGFIGSHMVRQLVGRGGVGITVLEPEGADVSRLPDCHIRLVQGALQDIGLIDGIIYSDHITHVVHLVSTMTPGSDYNDYLKELAFVVRPTIRLIELCCRRNVKLVFVSSCAVYGTSTDGLAFREDSPLAPISYYGIAKLLIESNIRFSRRTNGLNYLILRLSNPYGCGQKTDKKQGLIAVCMERMRTGQSLTVWGDGSAVRDYMFIDDMSDAAVSVIFGAENRAVNIGSGEGLTVNDVLGYVADITGSKLKTWHAPGRKCDASYVVLDTTVMRQFYRKPLTPMRKGIRRITSTT